MKSKSEYDKERRLKIINGTWSFNKKVPLFLTDEQLQIINGSLLGDAHLYQYKNQINAGLAIGRSTQDKEYLEYQYSFFKDFCKTSVQDRIIFDKRTGLNYYNSCFRTQVSKVFTSLRSKWYPNGTKIVPQDLELTPLTCAIWFCDDGSITGEGSKRRIALYTDSFFKKDVIFLRKLLLKNTGIEFGITRKNSMLDLDKGFYLYINSKTNVCKFISYIKNYVPVSMKRKSDRWKDYYNALV